MVEQDKSSQEQEKELTSQEVKTAASELTHLLRKNLLYSENIEVQRPIIPTGDFSNFNTGWPLNFLRKNNYDKLVIQRRTEKHLQDGIMKECQKSETVTIKTGNSSSFKYVSASRDVKGIDSALNAGVAVENSLLAVKKCKEMIEAIPQFRKSPITTPR